MSAPAVHTDEIEPAPSGEDVEIPRQPDVFYEYLGESALRFIAPNVGGEDAGSVQYVPPRNPWQRLQSHRVSKKAQEAKELKDGVDLMEAARAKIKTRPQYVHVDRVWLSQQKSKLKRQLQSGAIDRITYDQKKASLPPLSTAFHVSTRFREPDETVVPPRSKVAKKAERKLEKRIRQIERITGQSLQERIAASPKASRPAVPKPPPSSPPTVAPFKLEGLEEVQASIATRAEEAREKKIRRLNGNGSSGRGSRDRAEAEKPKRSTRKDTRHETQPAIDPRHGIYFDEFRLAQLDRDIEERIRDEVHRIKDEEGLDKLPQEEFKALSTFIRTTLIRDYLGEGAPEYIVQSIDNELYKRAEERGRVRKKRGPRS